MAHGLILEFPAGVGRAEYDAVNERLGLDPTDPHATWPQGLLAHSAGMTESGHWAVFERWDSRDSQAQFMHAALGPAFQATGLPAPTRVEWVDLVAATVVSH